MDTENMDDLKAYAERITAPAGWKRESATGYHDGSEVWSDEPGLFVVVSNEDTRLVFNLSPPGSWDKGAKVSFSGHTLYKGADNRWFSFSRRGIGDSFYGTDKTDPSETITVETARANEGRERNKNVLDVPGLRGIRAHKETVEKAKAALQAGKSWDFRPAGFGTGYHVTKKKSPFSKRAPASLEKFLNVQGLYIETTDCD